MPRPKLIYAGLGEWRPITRDYRECEHPREHLHFDSRYALPVWTYCLLCGQDRISPHHGLTEEQIAERRERARVLLAELTEDGEMQG
jgi:hypothetical protein